MVLFTRIETFPHEWERWGRALCLASPSRCAMQEGKARFHTVCWGAAPRLGAHGHGASSHSSKGRWGAALQPQGNPWDPAPTTSSSHFPATALQSPREHMKLPLPNREGRGGEVGAAAALALSEGENETLLQLTPYRGQGLPKGCLHITGRHWF